MSYSLLAINKVQFSHYQYPELAKMAQIPQSWSSYGHDTSRVHSVSPSLLVYAVFQFLQLAHSLSIQQVFWFPMTEDLNVTYQHLANGQAIQLVGLACSCIFVIPFTKKYGRRSTYVISTALVAAASWWTANMNTKVEVYLTNLLFGLAGATNEVAVEMTVSSLPAPTVSVSVPCLTN